MFPFIPVQAPGNTVTHLPQVVEHVGGGELQYAKPKLLKELAPFLLPLHRRFRGKFDH